MSKKLKVLPAPTDKQIEAEFSRRRHPGQIRRPGDFHDRLVEAIEEFGIDRSVEQSASTLASFVIAALNELRPSMKLRRLMGGLEVLVGDEFKAKQDNLIKVLLNALGSPADDPVSYLQIDHQRCQAFATAKACGWTLTPHGWIKIEQ